MPSLFPRGREYCLNILLYLVMYNYKVVEVLDLRTLYHYGLAHVHELRLCPADHEAPFKPAHTSGCVVDDVCLNYPH